MSKSRSIGWVALLALLAGIWSACDGRAAVPHRRVRIAAAADLNLALADIVARFGESHAVDVSVSYGSSGTFYAQLLNQAPFDLFLSADVEYPRRLAARGLTIAGGEFTYAYGRLVVWMPTGLRIDEPVDPLRALAAPGIAHVAVANPEHAPYGRAAIAALQSAGVYDAVKPKLVFGENVAQALQFAQSGAADAGIVAQSLTASSAIKDGGRVLAVPPRLYPPIEQGGAILKSAGDVDAARAFRAFLTGTDGRAALKQYGFAVPES